MNALILIAGLPGSGKTTVARAFAQRSGAAHLNSDVLRKTLGMMGHYTAADKAHVYDALLAHTEAALLRGETVVVDSTFYKEAIRTPYEHLAQKYQIPLFWVEVCAGEKSLRERLEQPRPDSEANYGVYLAIREQFEPLPDHRLILNTDDLTPEEAAAKIQLLIT